MTKILFVCLGNICRSPMAEAVMRHKVEKYLPAQAIQIDSAGTENYHTGEVPHAETRKVLTDNGISTEGLHARQLLKSDLDDFDYIIAMDESNLKDIRALSTQKNRFKIMLLSDFVEYCNWKSGKSVPDPWYTGNFQLTYKLIDEACNGILKKLKEVYHDHS